MKKSFLKLCISCALVMVLTVVFSVVAVSSVSAYDFDEEVYYPAYKTFDLGSFSYTDKNGVIWTGSLVDVQKDDADYGEEEFYAMISGCKNCGPEIVIPPTIKDNSGNTIKVGIVGNSDGARFNAVQSEGSEIGRIYFPDTVFLICKEAFDDEGDEIELYDLLEYIELPNNKDLVIGNSAFCGAGQNNALGMTLKFGSKPLYILDNAFKGCTGLESLEFPQGSTISEYAFTGCTGLTKVTNAPTEMSLDSDLLTEIIFDPTLTEVGGVWGLDGLKTVTLPENITYLGGFPYCPNLTTINNLNWDTIKEVGTGFNGCHSLKLENVKWPRNSLGYEFYDSGLVSISLRSDIQLIMQGSFVKCPNLQSIYVASGNGYYISKDGVLYEDGGNTLMKYPAGKSNGGAYTIPDDAYNLQSFAFDSCSFSEIILPPNFRKLYCGGLMETYDDSDIEYYPFDRMASDCVISYIKNSYIDDSMYGEITNIYSDANKKARGVKTNITLNRTTGESLPITYELNGGINNSNNPSTFVAGTSFRVYDPYKEGYIFDGWDHYVDCYMEAGVCTPMRYELISGTTLTAKWKEISKDTDPTNSTGGSSDTATSNGEQAASKLPAKGSTLNVSGGSKVKVLDPEAMTVAFTKAKNTKNVTVPATIKYDGNIYKVVQLNAKAFTGKKIRTVTVGKNIKKIQKNTFKGSPATKLILKSKLLKKSRVKGALKGSKIKTVQVKVGKKSLNKKYVKKYKKFFTKANAGKKVTVK